MRVIFQEKNRKTGCGLMAKAPALGAGDSEFESRQPDHKDYCSLNFRLRQPGAKYKIKFMNIKQSLTIFIAVSVLVIGFFLFFPAKRAEHRAVLDSGRGDKQVKVIDLNNKDIEVQIRDMTDVPPEYYSGHSRYSFGKCQTDNDCYNIGCSLEMCSSDKDKMTTCEINSQAPDKGIYSCGCIKDRCGWYKK